MTEARHNERRFYTYPLKQIVAILDDDAALQEALRHLDASGVELNTVHVLTGPEGERSIEKILTPPADRPA